MLGDALAGILRSQLGHYLDTEVGAVVQNLELLLTPILGTGAECGGVCIRH